MNKLNQYHTLELNEEIAQKLIDEGWQTNVVTWQFSPPGNGLVVDGNYEIVTNEIDLLELIKLHQQSIADEGLKARKHWDATAYSGRSSHGF